MCGIWALISNSPEEYIQHILRTLSTQPQKRGPDSTKNMKINNVYLTFHRLAINGLDAISMQPFNYQNKYFLICNGEIYNHKILAKRFGIQCETHSDCEIILHLYDKLKNPVKITEILDGVFAFVLYDAEQEKIIISRDKFGIRPLYWGINKDKSMIISSTLGGVNHPDFDARQIPGNTTYVIDKYMNAQTYERPWYNAVLYKGLLDEGFILEQLRFLLINSVKKRLMSDRKICCLLSGGLDSSLITSIVCKLVGSENIETFSIGMEGGTDTQYAEEVSRFLGTKHTSVIHTKEEFLAAIPEVIEHIETFDTTTVRASVGNYLISKYIKDRTDNVVVFNGDGSDELFGGYLYFHNAPTPTEYSNEIMRLLKNIYSFDVQRSDRSISSNGLEPRTPFLDHDLTSFWLNVAPELRNTRGVIEKWWLRKAFDDGTFLPNSILWRKKEAFSDGVSANHDSWGDTCSKWAGEYLRSQGENGEAETGETGERNARQFDLLETQCYHNIFKRLYPNKDKAVHDELWLPKWSGDQKDPSARALSVYTEHAEHTEHTKHNDNIN
jgi:asparagine synthase (glutamine-hydrolysing)